MSDGQKICISKRTPLLSSKLENGAFRRVKAREVTRYLSVPISSSSSSFSNNTTLSSNVEKMLVASLGGSAGDGVGNGQRAVADFIGVEWR